MPTPIKQFKDSSSVVHDLDNRSITLSATSGTLTTDQLAVLQASDKNCIKYGDGIFRLVYATSSELWYQRFLSASAASGWIKVTISSRAFAYTTEQLVTSAFKNVVVGSTTIAADSNQDTLTLVAGSNVTLTPDATNDKVTIAATDTKNTAGSTDTPSKIFLVGATSQAANPQTYSDNQVYATNGQLDANKVRIAEAVTLVYDSTNKCLNFNFA